MNRGAEYKRRYRERHPERVVEQRKADTVRRRALAVAEAPVGERIALWEKRRRERERARQARDELRAMRANLKALLEGLAEYELKQCPRCGSIKRLEMFGRKGNRPFPACYACEAARAAAYKARNRGKVQAQREVASALRTGTLAPAEACEDCGKVWQLDAHHEDYARPLDVAWLCRPCHMRRHGRDTTQGTTGKKRGRGR